MNFNWDKLDESEKQQTRELYEAKNFDELRKLFLKKKVVLKHQVCNSCAWIISFDRYIKKAIHEKYI